MAEVPLGHSVHDFDPCSSWPSGREAKDHVTRKGFCQPKDVTFPADKRNRRFLSVW